jgi:flagellar motor component MotA
MYSAGIIGLTASLTLVIVTVLMGETSTYFFNPPSFILVVGLSLTLQQSSFGIPRLIRGMKLSKLLVMEKTTLVLEREDVIFMQHLIPRLYLSGMLGTLIGWMQILAYWDSVLRASHLPTGLMISLLTIFYAIILAEFFVRPLVHRMEHLLPEAEK